MEVVVADRWTPGSLADRISRLVWGVDDYNRDEVRDFADEVQAMQDRLALLESAARRLRAEEWEAATAEERRAVVVWLRSEAPLMDGFAAAGCIERGEHVAEGGADAE
jgi:hypothetical protein